ncbi:DUF4097 family beta strand repeat-containing protein [Paenibacillus paeoniae]|uniref:DUF4097 domain-containing protein n=1 Tax=Paenibacillus paeoniae TaxID=2292705 RepID=A0A371NZR4_9BACL|nr:DUF4097 family beta strand repeat-containing protein [Paenibacillus paeoniae]REK69111.1 hypothetical protein DX130_25630 [Paenibacillus paeoniae]
MRPKTTIGIILIIVGIIGVLYVYENGSNTTFESIRNVLATEVSEQETIDASDIRNLDISSGSTDVVLVPGSGSDVVIKLEGWASKNYVKNLKIESSKKEGTLQLSLKSDRGFRFGFGLNGVKMTVELPEKTWSQLSVDLNSGNLAVQGINAENTKLHTNSGNVKATELKTSNNLIVTVNSGNLNLRSITAKSMDLTTQSGNLSMKGYESDNISFKVGSGNVHFKDGTAALKGKTGSGNIKVEADSITRDTELNTGAGNVTITLANNPNSLSVQFKASSGEGVIQKDDFTYDSGSKGSRSIKGKFGSGETKLNVKTGSGNFTLK